MSNNTGKAPSRRDFLKKTGSIVAASSLAGVGIPKVHAAENNTIRLALIGCGARGTGAVANALMVKQGPVKLVATADVFADRIEHRLKYLQGSIEASWDRSTAKGLGARIDVPPERRFVGFDAYRKAMDCLGPGDVAILATP
ncbi:MAG: twin-arginine translocation signal domain-containing protein, partial [Rhodopirellula sp.]|nr:twin-arginine translocation signal domain-containing protein [Rhodopirellula sp.]